MSIYEEALMQSYNYYNILKYNILKCPLQVLYKEFVLPAPGPTGPLARLPGPLARSAAPLALTRDQVANCRIGMSRNRSTYAIYTPKSCAYNTLCRIRNSSSGLFTCKESMVKRAIQTWYKTTIRLAISAATWPGECHLLLTRIWIIYAASRMSRTSIRQNLAFLLTEAVLDVEVIIFFADWTTTFRTFSFRDFI